MSDRPIQVGDLVAIVRGHSCTVDRFAGIPLTVEQLIQCSGSGYRCPICREWNAGPKEYSVPFRGGHVPISWLKRFNPPAHGDSLPTRKRMKEPA